MLTRLCLALQMPGIGMQRSSEPQCDSLDASQAGPLEALGERRELIALLGGSAVSWPLVARAQQAKMATIGLLGPNSSSIDGPRVAAFVQRLGELGWVEGRNVAIEYRWAEGRVERLREFAAEFVRLNVDVIVTSATPPVVAAKQATSVIPIVFAAVGDPVGNGLVASLARPGGNVTGLSLQATDLAGKRLELLREVVPALRHLAIMANRDSPAPVVEMREVQATASTLGLDVITSEIRSPEDIAPAIEAFKGRAEGLYICNDPLVTTNRARIAALALSVRLPTMFNVREFVEAGGLMSYGPNFLALYRRTGDFVDKILRGAKPADLPVEQPTMFDLTLNLKTAKALGLTVPQSMLARANEVIE
jgi:putative ABC transport system substrate-binding protein